MKPPSVVAGTAFAAPISRAYDEPTPQQDEDSMVRALPGLTPFLFRPKRNFFSYDERSSAVQ